MEMSQNPRSEEFVNLCQRGALNQCTLLNNDTGCVTFEHHMSMQQISTTTADIRNYLIREPYPGIVLRPRPSNPKTYVQSTLQEFLYEKKHISTTNHHVASRCTQSPFRIWTTECQGPTQKSESDEKRSEPHAVLDGGGGQSSPGRSMMQPLRRKQKRTRPQRQWSSL